MDTPEDVRSDDLAVVAPTWFRRRRRNWLQRGVATLTGGIAVYGLTVVVGIPLVVYFGAGVWSLIAYARTLFSLWNFIQHGELRAFLDGVGGADLAVRVALASGAYFALLFALIVIFSGLFGRGWRRLLLLPGLILGIPALLIFLAGMQAAADALSTALPISGLVASLITIYALVDLAVLAGFLTDLRPRRRQRVAEQEAVLLPLVRFGPPLTVLAAADGTSPSEPALFDETPSDPMMTASVARALNNSVPVTILPVTILPVTILPVTAGQRDEASSEATADELSTLVGRDETL